MLKRPPIRHITIYYLLYPNFRKADSFSDPYRQRNSLLAVSLFRITVSVIAVN